MIEVNNVSHNAMATLHLEVVKLVFSISDQIMRTEGGMEATQLSIQHGWSFGSVESRRSGSNHSKAIPFKYDWAKVTFAQSWWKAFGQIGRAHV